MAWERFGYVCRKASVDFRENEDISACLKRIEAEDACSLYGKQMDQDGLPRAILNRIGLIQNREEAQKALAIYKDLNLTKNLEEPMKFKRAIAYLAWIASVFYIVAGIYQVKVAPTFISALENMEVAMPRSLEFFQDWWVASVVVVSVLLGLALLIGFEMRNFFRFKTGVEERFFVKRLVLRGIRTSYVRIINVLQYPVFQAAPEKVASDQFVIEHLRALESSEMNVATEMREIIGIEMQRLLLACEKQIRLISVVVAIVVVSAVFLLMASVYAPIFVLGDSI